MSKLFIDSFLHCHYQSGKSASILMKKMGEYSLLNRQSSEILAVMFIRYVLLNLFRYRPIFELSLKIMHPFDVIYSRQCFLFNVLS
jgi:hypothetical protein